MEQRPQSARMLFLAAAIWATLSGSALAQGQRMTDLIDETQKQSALTSVVRLVWWVPEEFWSTSFENDDNMTPEQREEFLRAVRPYTMISAADGTVGAFGGVSYAGKDSLRAYIRLVDRTGKTYAPLAEGNLSGDVQNLSMIFQTMLGNMLGATGQNMHIFFFPASSPDGAPIAAATKEGRFAVQIRDETFTWRLPLGSLLPRKACPEDGEQMSGAWRYCPWHGKLLTSGEIGKARN